MPASVHAPLARAAATLFIAIFASWTSAGCAHESQQGRPNIVLIVIDDLGWNDVGFSGSDYHLTPTVDRLASEGLVFTQGYANAANCLPSRAALMSGAYAPRTGVYTVDPPARGNAKKRRLIPAANTNELGGEFVTLAEVLKERGYATCHVGKWHLGSDTGPSSPEEQGFDRNIAGYHRGHPKSYFSPYQNPALSDGQPGEYLTDRLTQEATQFIEDADGSPFFLYFSTYTVHTPIQPRPDLETREAARPRGEIHQNASYAAMVAAMDEAVDGILAALEKTGSADDTLVVFTSDNGGHGGVTSMTPLRGSKGMVYEGGIRVPLVVRWPGRVSAGRSTAEPALLFDLYPTLAEAAGAELPLEQPIDGRSLMPVLLGDRETLPERSMYWHFPAYLERYRGMDVPWRATPCSVIRRGTWKLIEQYETETVELYDLEKDPAEQRNLADDEGAIVAELLADLHAWHARVGAPTRFEANPKYRSDE